MEIEILESADTSARIRFEGVDPSFVNALRRTLLTDIPKMAIEDVEFHLGPIRAEDGKENESVAPLFDEMIAHRIGLIPIPTDMSMLVPKATCPTCKGEGCTSCTIIFSL